MDGAEAGTCPGRSVLLYMRTRTRPGDRARRGKIPAPRPPHKPCTSVHYRAHPFRKALQKKGIQNMGPEPVSKQCVLKRAKRD
jgi:hypothetical protein